MDIEHVNRRTVVLGAGAIALGAGTVAVVTACSSDQATSTTPAPGTELTTTNKVPVGSGVIVGDTVVTQPKAGTYLAFSATCTHAGCQLNEVVDGTVRCPCHGSQFNLDGTVNTGPATAPLPPQRITVQGDQIISA